MKTTLKFLFVITAIAFMVNALAQTDNIIMKATVLLFGMAILYLLIPAHLINMDQLNDVTNVKVWNKYIIEKLRRNNDWLFRSSDESRNVLGGAVVYIPQAGADPEIEVNSTTYPGTAVNRTDSDVNYVLDIFRTKPHRVPWADLQFISYDKIDSVLSSHGNALAEAVGDSMLIRWAATVSGKKIFTTGNDVGPVGNQTGNRKGFSHKDLMAAMIQMNVENVPKEGRVCVIDDNMYGYFYDEMTDKQFNAFNQFADNATGRLGRLHGFDIYSRSAVLNYGSNASSPNAYGATQLADDNLASLCWHPDMVCRAVGETKIFYNKDLAIEYGDLMSAILKFGGRKKRADGVGVISIVQG
jgi:hypothetical protein